MKHRFLIIALSVLAIVLVAAGVNAITAASDARRHPHAGRLVDIGGVRLNLHCTGSGSPAVILEAGWGGLLSEWEAVQTQVAGFTRVCSYDRAGYGDSDPGPMPRTSARIAEELHALLRRAGEKPPYVLVGASFGGYNVRVFRGKYPDLVAGAVLIDAVHEDQYDRLPEAWKQLSAQMRERYRRQARWAPLYVDLGIARLQLRLQGVNASHLVLRSRYLRARAAELEQIRTSAEQARAAGDVGSKPLVVVTAGAGADPSLREADRAAYQEVWMQLQQRLVRLSTQGRHIVVEGAGHDIAGERPDIVVTAIRDVL